jgi:hypothetical protein
MSKPIDMGWSDQCQKCHWKPDNKYTAIAKDRTGLWVCLKCADLVVDNDG